MTTFDPDLWAGWESGFGNIEHDSNPAESPEGDSWLPVNLDPYITGEYIQPTPEVGLIRSDGMRMLYPGLEHAIIGEMESGKSWFALQCAAAELLAGNYVVYIHFEESNPAGTVERLLLLGIPGHVLRKQFMFVSPEKAAKQDSMTYLLSLRPTLVILDGVNEAMSLHGNEIRNEDGAAAFRRRLVKPCTKEGAAVLSCDHVVKDKEGRGRYALGSIHKGNALNGSLISLENAEPFGRGQRGRSHVYLMKDRPGFLRQHGRPVPKMPGKTFMGEFIVDDTREMYQELVLDFWAPSYQQNAEMSQMGSELGPQILSALTRHEAQPESDPVNSRRKLFAVLRAAGVTARDEEVRATLDDLVLAKHLIEIPGSRGGVGYHTMTASHDQLF